jgi:hypothetical protein
LKFIDSSSFVSNGDKLSRETRFGFGGVASNLCIRSFNPDVRRTNDALLVGSVIGVTLTIFFGVPFDEEGEEVFVDIFFSSTNRPRCFAEDGGGGLVFFSLDAGGWAGEADGGGGGGEGSCSTITASFERKRNGDRCLNVFNIPLDGLSDFFDVGSLVSKSISSSRK